MSVHPGTTRWDRLKAYTCRHCDYGCIEPLDADWTESEYCRECYTWDSLEPADRSLKGPELAPLHGGPEGRNPDRMGGEREGGSGALAVADERLPDSLSEPELAFLVGCLSGVRSP
jgi:hypothetical protein